MQAMGGALSASRNRIRSGASRFVARLACLLIACAGTAYAQPQCPPTSPDPISQTVVVGETPAPLRIQLDVIASFQPPPDFFFFTVTAGTGQFPGGITKVGVPVMPVLVDAGASRWRYSGEIAVLPPTVPGAITIEGDAPICFLQPGPTGVGTVTYTINVVDQPPPPPPPPADPSITVLEGAGAQIDPGRLLDLRVRLDDVPAGQNVSGYPLVFTIAAGSAVFDQNGSATVTTATSGDGTAGVRIRAGTTAGPVSVEVRPAADAPFTALPASIGFAVVQPAPRNFVLISGNGQSGAAGAVGAPLVAGLTESNGFPAGDVAVEWRTVEGPALVLDQPSGRTAANGRIQTGIRFAAQAGTSIVEARAITGETLRYTVTTTPAQAARTLAVASGADQTGALNSDADLPIVFNLTENGQPVAGEVISFRVAEGSASLAATSASTDSSGRASVRFRYGGSAGRIRIEASTANLVASAFATAFLPDLRIVSGNGQSARAGTRLPQDLVIEIAQPVAGDVGKGFTGVPVTWSVVSGGGTLGTASNATDARGRAANQLTLGTTAGENRIRATLPGIGSIDFVATATPPPVNRIAVASGDGQSGALNSDADQPIVFVLTEDGRPIAGETLSFRVIEGSATLASTSASTNAEGRASIGFRYGNASGRIRIEASARGTSAVATATAFAPNLRIVAGNNQAGRVGTRLPQDLVLEISQSGTAELEKGFSGVPVTWSVVSGGGTLGTASNATDARGRAANQLTLGTTAGENRIRATLPGIGSIDFVATATPPPVNRIAVASGDGQSGALNSDADQPIVFVLTEDNVPVGGEALAIRVTEGAATLLTPSATTDAQGRASIRFRYGASAGRVRIEASARGTAGLATATAFAPNLRVASGNAQSGRIATRLAQDLVLEIAQPALAAGAKGLAGVPVTWSIVSGGGSLAAASGTTDAQGRASNQLTLGPTAGENRVRATLAGIGTLDFVATAVDPVPAGSVFEIVSGDGQSLATAAPSAPLVVRLRTSAGTAVAGTTVAFSVSPAGAATLSNATATTGANGQAQTIATLGLPGAVRITASLPDAGAGGPTLVFTLNGGVVNTLALDPQERGVASAIDAACPALFQQSQQGSLPPAAADLLARCSELVGSAGVRPDAVKDALREMLSEESDAQNTASIGAARAQYDNLASRVSALRAGSTGLSVDGLALAGGNGALPLSFLPTTQLMQSDGDAETEVGADFSRWGFFATGTIGQGELDDRGDSPGFDFDTYGLTAGVDYRFSDTFVAGVAVGYSDTDTDVNGGAGELATRGLSLSGYGTWYRGESFYVDGVATIGRNSYELSRRVLYTLGNTRIDQTALADPDGDQRSFALSVGRDVNRGALNISPYLRAAWTRIEFDPYTERMSNPTAAGSGLALAVEGRTLRSFEGVLGAKASYTMSRDWGILIPHATIEILREFEDQPNTVVSRFVNDPTRTPILVQGLVPDRDYFNLGLGLSGVFAGGRSAFIYLENRAGQRDYTQTTLAAGVRIEF